MLYFVDRTWLGRHFSSGYQIRLPERLRLCHLLWWKRSFILLLKSKNRKIYERVGSWSPAFPCFIKLSHVWWCGTLQIALREVIITEVSLHFSTVLLDWTDLKENLMKQLSVKWLYSVVDVLSTVFIPLTAFLFPVSPLIYQCNYRAAKKFCWNSLFSPLSTAFSFSNCYFFYIPWLPINSSKRKSLFESQSLSLVLLCIWFILGARVRLFSSENCLGIGGLSHVKVPGVNGLMQLTS